MTNTLAALSASSKGPKEEIAAGKVPLPQTISLQPPTSPEATQSYAHLDAAASVASLQTVIFNEDFRVGRGQTKHYDISVAGEEASLAFADMAAAGLRVMEGPLSGFYTRVKSAEHVFSQSMRRREVHGAFLEEVFRDYRLGESALRRLDGVLTAFVAAVRGVEFGVGKGGGTVDYSFRINHVVREGGPGADGTEMKHVFRPRTRIVCLKIDPNTYKWATDKGTDEVGTFQMSYATHDFDLDVGRFLASKERFDIVFQGLLGEDTTSYAKMTNHLVGE